MAAREDQDPEWWERIIDGADPAAELGPDEDDPESFPEVYTPPPPPPFPTLSPVTVLGVAAALGGLALVLWPSWLAGTLSVSTGLVMLIGLAGVLGGVWTLMGRLRPGDEDDPEPPDEGAVV
jgi:hypothetical protein